MIATVFCCCDTSSPRLRPPPPPGLLLVCPFFSSPPVPPPLPRPRPHTQAQHPALPLVSGCSLIALLHHDKTTGVSDSSPPTQHKHLPARPPRFHSFAPARLPPLSLSHSRPTSQNTSRTPFTVHLSPVHCSSQAPGPSFYFFFVALFCPLPLNSPLAPFNSLLNVLIVASALRTPPCCQSLADRPSHPRQFNNPTRVRHPRLVCNPDHPPPNHQLDPFLRLLRSCVQSRQQ